MPSRSIVRRTRVVSASTWVSVPDDRVRHPDAVAVTARSGDSRRELGRADRLGAPCADPPERSVRGHRDPRCVPADGDRSDRSGGMDARRTTRPERSSSRTTAPSTPTTQTPAPPVATAAAGTSRIVSVMAPVVASARTTEKSGATAQSASLDTARWLSTRFDVEPPTAEDRSPPARCASSDRDAPRRWPPAR